MEVVAARAFEVLSLALGTRHELLEQLMRWVSGERVRFKMNKRTTSACKTAACLLPMQAARAAEAPGDGMSAPKSVLWSLPPVFCWCELLERVRYSS